MKKAFLLFLIAFLSFTGHSQDIRFARKVIDTLGSPFMHGRAYMFDGDKVAAAFIKNIFAEKGLKPFGENYFQPFTISVNSFPGKVNASINKKNLQPAIDYFILPFAKTVKKNYRIVRYDTLFFNSQKELDKLFAKDFSRKVLLIDNKGIKDKLHLAFFSQMKVNNLLGAAGYIFIIDRKPSWGMSVASRQADYFVMDVVREKVPPHPKKIGIDLEASFQEGYQTQNVIAFVEGKTQPDSFVVFTAHYDHLGHFGKDVYFPGANDNASGTAMMLDLAGYFAKPENRPDFSIAFMAFSGEETGLLGSKYYVDNPLFPLEKIKLLVNLDMVGTGEDGIKVVNGATLDKPFNMLEEINQQYEFLPEIGKRGESAHSDHYYFYEKGVPAIFIYTTGIKGEYHTPGDTEQNISLAGYEGLFKLLVETIKLY